MKKVIGALIVLAFAIALGSCGGGGSDDASTGGNATVNISAGRVSAAAAFHAAAIPDTVTAIVVTVSGPGMSAITASLPLDGSVLALSVPAGTSRVFTADAFEGPGNRTYTGSTSVAQLVAGATTRVSLTLNPVGPDTTRPTVVSTAPISGAIDVPVTNSVSITFSEAMTAVTLDSPAANLRLTHPDPFAPSGGATVTVAGTVAYDPATFRATFTPSSGLPAGTLITVTLLSPFVTDVAGNAVADSPSLFQFTFTTAAVADTTSPTVTLVDPVNDAPDVPVNQVVTVTFSEDIACGTVNATSFTLTGSGPVSGSIGCVGPTITFTPDASLANGQLHTVSVTTAVTDLAGNPVASAFVSFFTTVAASGGLTCDDGDFLAAEATFPIVVTAVGNGDALVAGVLSSTQQDLFARRRIGPNIGGWTAPQVISPPGSTGQFIAPVRLVGNGAHAVAAWLHFDPAIGRNTLWARRYDVTGNAWLGSAELIQAGSCAAFPCTGTSPVHYVRAVMDGAGTATIIWVQQNGASDYRVLARRWPAGGVPGTIDQLASGVLIADLLAEVAPTGEVVTAWWENTGIQSRINSSTFRGGFWEVPTLGVPSGFSPLGLTVATGGAAMVMWRDTADGGTRQVVKVVRSGTGPDSWGSVRELVFSGGAGASLAGASDGRAVFLSLETGSAIARARKFDPANLGGTPTGWDDPVDVDLGDADSGSWLLKSNGNGDMLFGEQRMSPTEQPTVSVRSFTMAGGWDPTGMLEIGDTNNSELQDVVVDANGSSTVIWRVKSSGVPLATQCQ